MPKWTCPKAYAGRERFVAAFEDYINHNGPDTASPIVQARNQISDEHGLSINDKARFEVVQGHAILANTIPTAFWTLFHVLSDPSILAEVREEASKLLTIKTQNGVVTHTLDISKIRDIAILHSTLHESLRHYGSGTGSRIVTEDIMLDEKYLLKKNSFVFMPNKSYHFDQASWGPTVNGFNARRFIDVKSVPGGAFRGFGGGATLCPGRFFAMNEILTMCAMFALKYEITPTSGSWEHLDSDDSNMSLLVHPPRKTMNVNVAVRKGWEGGSWAFTI